MNKGILLTVLLIASFLILVFYRYSQFQKAVKAEKPSVLNTWLISFPDQIALPGSASISWHVESPRGVKTSLTTLYWGYESSPSALREYDAPQAVGYPDHFTDYETGEFTLPQDFSVSLKPDRPGKIFFRSYAKVQDKHLWSQEHTLTILPKSNAAQ